MSEDPFGVLGLPARARVSDDDVRAAWRRIAAATHPDREDGGDPALFGRAAAAYVTLRTADGRGEALAERPRAGLGGFRPGLRARGGALARRIREFRWVRGWCRAVWTTCGILWAPRGAQSIPRHGVASGGEALDGVRGARGTPGVRGAGGRHEGRWRGWTPTVVVAGAGLAGMLAIAVAGWTPGSIGVLTGTLTAVAVLLRGWRARG